MIDPDRIRGNHYSLVHRQDHKLCSKSVTRCEQCRTAFNQTDVVLLKTVGVRERTDNSGKILKHTGNIYLHYLTKCLMEYDQNFKFGAIIVPHKTIQLLPSGRKEAFQKKGLQVESQ